MTVQVLMIQISSFCSAGLRRLSGFTNPFDTISRAMDSDSHWFTLQPRVMTENVIGSFGLPLSGFWFVSDMDFLFDTLLRLITSGSFKLGYIFSDPSTAENFIAVVKYSGLPGGDGMLGGFKSYKRGAPAL